MADTPSIRSHLHLVCWNANGLHSKLTELKEFIHSHKPDILLISETHLRPADKLNIPNFNTYRTDRPTGRGGGTAILLKRTIPQYPAPSLQTNMETTSVFVKLANHADIRVIAAYAPPNTKVTEADWTTIFNTHTPTILGGDLNSKHPSWNSRLTNTKGKTLHNMTLNSQITVHGPAEPTHYGIGRPDVLDLFVTQHISLPTQIYTLTELSSDHNPVNFIIGEGESTTELTHTRTNWTRFTDLLLHTPIIPRPANKREIDSAVNTITTTITAALKQASTQKATPFSPKLPAALTDLIRTKNKAIKRYQRTLAPSDRTTKNQLIAQVKIALDHHRNEQWNRKLQSINSEPSDIWKLSKALKSSHPKLPPLHSQRGLVYTPTDKAAALADSIERQCSLNHHLTDITFTNHVNKTVKNNLKSRTAETITPTSPHEISRAIKQLKKHKAPGPDRLSNTAIKHLPHRIIMSLTNIYNSCFQHNHFPTPWKLADIIVLPKPGKNPIFPQNHRPISLLSHLGKLLEKLLLTRLQTELTAKNIIPPEQFGFKTHHSTIHQIHRIIEHSTHGFNHKQHTGLILLDISKAFDKVWHAGLLYKMIQHKLNPSLIKITASYLHGRSFQVKLDSIHSTPRPLEAGVPQGSKLSPTLYNIYTSDLPKSPDTHLALFADDTALFTSSKSTKLITKKLQTALTTIEAYFTKWLIEINPEKTQAILLTKRRPRHRPTLAFNLQHIPWLPTVKYLGVILDEKLTFRDQIRAACNKALGIFKNQYPLLNGKTNLNLQNKRLLYKALILPILTYAAPAWGHAAQCHLSRLQIMQNKCLRSITNAPWYMRNNQIHRDLNVKLIKETIQDQAEKYFATAKLHNNRLISSQLNYTVNTHFTHKRPMNMLT